MENNALDPANQRLLAGLTDFQVWLGRAAILPVFLLSHLGFAADYSKCAVTQETYGAGAGNFCIPQTQGQVPTRGNQFTVSPASGQQGAPLVFVLPARNCRSATNRYVGDVVLVLDSSQSLEKTDPDDERMSGTDFFVDELARLAEANGSTLSLAVVGYAGRMRYSKLDPNNPDKPLYSATVLENGIPTLAQSPLFEDSLCINGDDTAQLEQAFSNNGKRPGFSARFNAPDAAARWNDKLNPADAYPLSICEYLPKVPASQKNAADLITPSMSRQKEFLRLPVGAPRGATDVSFMLKTAQYPTLLGGSSERARHAIMITDGLPNLPLRRPKGYCLLKDFLQKDNFETDPLAPLPELFCIDRNFRQGVNESHEVALAQYKATNLHNVLYWSKPNESFIDFDDEGTLNPADFLIENSARTGNGKVKFLAAQGAQNLREVLSKIIPSFDAASLQRVDITVTDAAGRTYPKYAAVSPAGFIENAADPQDKRFDLKILYLRPGVNSALVDYVYGDATISETLTITVASAPDAGSITPGIECAGASSNFTVDGDRKDYPICLKRDPRDRVPAAPAECSGSNPPKACACKAPSGDGFLPFPDDNGNIRIYRNADPANKEFENQDQFAQAKNYATPNKKVEARNLRIQGGTGNCGVIGGLTDDEFSGADDSAGRSLHKHAQLLTLCLYLLPLVVSGAWSAFQTVRVRRRNPISMRR